MRWRKNTKLTWLSLLKNCGNKPKNLTLVAEELKTKKGD